MNLTLPYADDVATFAQSVRRHCERHVPTDDWKPGLAVSDHSAAMTAALTETGWFDLPAEGEEVLSYIGVGGFELGHACAPYDTVTMLLGGSIVVDGLVLYGETGAVAITPGPGGMIVSRELIRSEPLPYIDSLGIHTPQQLGEERISHDPGTLRAWHIATVGYFAGLTAAALDRATEHATSREAFGTTLSALDAVRHKLADAALIVEALRLSAVHAGDGLPALALACSRAQEVAAHSHQVLGAMGFTREYDLQRFTRRIRALSALLEIPVERSLP